MAKKEKVRVDVKVRELKNIPQGSNFKIIDNKGNLSSKTYTKDEYNRSAKKYYATDNNNLSNSRLLKGTTKVTTDFIY